MGAAAAAALAATLMVVAGEAVQAASPPVAFAPPTDYATDGVDLNVAIGDLNGDAHPDLATASFDGPDEVSVRFGIGDGTFGPPVGFGTGAQPTSVAIDDLDGDGDLDLVVTNVGRSSEFNDFGLSVLLNNGDGTFAPYIQIPAYMGGGRVAIADLNHDADPDVVVTHGAAPSLGLTRGRVSVQLGNGDGTFAVAFDRTFDELYPRATAVGDVTGDGHPDLVVAGSDNSPRLWVLVGNGDGTFGPSVEHNHGGHTPSAAAIGDLDGDGANEVVVGFDVCCSTTSSYIAVLPVNPDGTIGPGTDASMGNQFGPESLTLGDLNGDSHLDVAAVSGQQSVSVLLGNGDGTLDAPTQFAADWPVSVSVADLNGDDRLDITTANFDSSSLSVLLNATVPVAPDAPTIIKNATAGNSEATVSWTAPVADGGSPITGYVVTPYVGYFPFPPITFNSTATTQVITGRVANGLTYRFRVQAMNSEGISDYSKVTNPVEPSTTPAPGLGAPTIIRNATAGGGSSATVSWTAPAADGGSPVTGYLVTPYVGYFPLQAYMFHSTATTQTLTNLYPAGATFRFRVQAVNAVGTGTFSTVTNPVTPSP